MMFKTIRYSGAIQWGFYSLPTVVSGELPKELKQRLCCGHSTMSDTVQGVGDTSMTKHTKIPTPVKLKFK